MLAYLHLKLHDELGDVSMLRVKMDTVSYARFKLDYVFPLHR